MAATRQQRLERIRDNYEAILLLLTEVMASGYTRDSIDALVIAADSSGVPRPTVTHSVGNRSYDWNGYQTMLLDSIEKLNDLARQASGPYAIKTYGRV